MSTNRFKTSLYAGSCCYLVLPYLIFFGGWIRQPYSTVLILLLLGGVYASYRMQASKSLEKTDAGASQFRIWPLLIPVLAIALIAGAGGWGFQYGDWAKHNSILRDLVTESWPVIYDVAGQQIMLTYYAAYQLPAALAGKLFGWNVANHVLFAYTLVGLCLSALWIQVLTNIRAWWLFLAFIALSGMDVIGQIVVTGYTQPTIDAAINALSNAVFKSQHLEWWAGWGFAQYSSMAALVFLVPNQATAGWILTALVLHDAKSGRLGINAVLYVALCALWAPFVALGLLPLVLFLLAYEWKNDGYGFNLPRCMISWPNIAGLSAGLMVTVYFMGRFQSFDLPIDLDNIVYDEQITFTFLRIPDLFYIRYLMFILLEFVVLHGLLFAFIYLQQRPASRQQLWLLGFSFVFLVFLPFLNWGWNNEPSMRSSIPALFITALITLRVLVDPPRIPVTNWIKRGVVGLLLLGALNATYEIGRQVIGTAVRGELVAVPEANDIDTIFEIQEDSYKEYHNFVGQYVGSSESIFARHFAKR
jgi:hypothetical protein